MLILIELANLWGLNKSMFIKDCFKNFLVGVTERHYPLPPHMALMTNQSLILWKFLLGNWSSECTELTQCGMWPPTGEGGWCQSSCVEGPHSSVDGGFPINIEEPLLVVTLSLYTLAHHRDMRSHAIRSELHTIGWQGWLAIQVTHPTSSFYEGIVVRVNKNSWDKCLYTGTAELLKMPAAWLGRESRTRSPGMEWSAAWSPVNGTRVAIKTFYKYPHVLSLQFQVQKFILQKWSELGTKLSVYAITKTTVIVLKSHKHRFLTVRWVSRWWLMGWWNIPWLLNVILQWCTQSSWWGRIHIKWKSRSPI